MTSRFGWKIPKFGFQGNDQGAVLHTIERQLLFHHLSSLLNQTTKQ